MFHHRRTAKTTLLDQLPLFRGLPAAQLGLIARHADQAVVPAATVLAQPGHLAREVVLVCEGILRVEVAGATVEQLYPGDTFGELSLLAGRPITATVVAETPASLVVFDARSFASVLAAVPAVQRRLLEGISGRLWQAEAAPLLALAS